MAWEERDARALFSQLLDATLRDGPQVVTRRGVETAVLISIDEWHRLKHAARPTLKQLLLAPDARLEISIAKRGGLRRRRSHESA
jgi:antitoxin Phd